MSQNLSYKRSPAEQFINKQINDHLVPFVSRKSSQSLNDCLLAISQGLKVIDEYQCAKCSSYYKDSQRVKRDQLNRIIPIHPSLLQNQCKQIIEYTKIIAYTGGGVLITGQWINNEIKILKCPQKALKIIYMLKRTSNLSISASFVPLHDNQQNNHSPQLNTCLRIIIAQNRQLTINSESNINTKFFKKIAKIPNSVYEEIFKLIYRSKSKNKFIFQNHHVCQQFIENYQNQKQLFVCYNPSFKYMNDIIKLPFQKAETNVLEVYGKQINRCFLIFGDQQQAEGFIQIFREKFNEIYQNTDNNVRIYKPFMEVIVKKNCPVLWAIEYDVNYSEIYQILSLYNQSGLNFTLIQNKQCLCIIKKQIEQYYNKFHTLLQQIFDNQHIVDKQTNSQPPCSKQQIILSEQQYYIKFTKEEYKVMALVILTSLFIEFSLINEENIEGKIQEWVIYDE